MKESLREALTNFYGQRDSKSASPSSGRIHKQRQSFGPTVCLISKNPENENEVSNDKLQIFMLILQIQRLNRVVVSLINSTKNIKDSGSSEEVQYLKKQLSSLKSNLQRVEQQKYEQIQRQNRVIYANSNKITQYQTQMKLNNRRIGQLEDTNNGLHQKIKMMEQQVGRARSEASRANMNVLMNTSQTQLQKSMIKERSIAEMQLWKEKLIKYQNMLNQQKQFINGQKLTIDKLNNTQLQIRQRYEYDMSMAKKTIQQLTQKCQRLQRQLNSKLQSNSAEANRQLSIKQKQLQQLRERIAESGRENLQFRNNLEKITRSKDETIEEMRAVINQLRQSLQEMNEHFHQTNQKHQKCKGQIGHLRKQNQVLRSQINQINKNYSDKINNLQQQIRNNQNQVRRLNKNRKKLQEQNKMKKSMSESNIRTASTSLRLSRTDLGGIIQDVIQLQDSNTRVNRLIESSKSRMQVLHHRDVSLNHYGL